MPKHAIDSIGRKNRIVSNIIERLTTGQCFLILGHANPDEDCIAAMVSFALLASKFEKEAIIFITGKTQEQLQYLLDICDYNAIRVIRGGNEALPRVDTLVACDTPKPGMIAAPPGRGDLLTDDSIVRIEFDHHIASDSDYIGDDDHALVTEASSACELVGYVALKLCHRPELLEEYHIAELFSRNLVLAILTGIIGDSQMGKFLKSKRERRFYAIFSGMFNELLAAKTTNRGNFSNKEEVFTELGRLSAREQECFSYMMERSGRSKSICHVLLDEDESRHLFGEFGEETVVSVARAVADTLAERCSRLSLIGYHDIAKGNSLVQFRARRSHEFKSYDVRKIIDLFSIADGGGHEGAIGFRFGRDEVGEIKRFGARLVEQIEADLGR